MRASNIVVAALLAFGLAACATDGPDVRDAVEPVVITETGNYTIWHGTIDGIECIWMDEGLDCDFPQPVAQ